MNQILPRSLTSSSLRLSALLAEKIEAALAKAVRKTATLGQMVLTDLNVRKKKSSQASMNEAAWRLQIEVWQNSVILNPVSRRLSRAPFP